MTGTSLCRVFHVLDLRLRDAAPDIDIGETLGADLFGSAMFMLSRYEEIARPEPDRHERFPATASLAYRDPHLYEEAVLGVLLASLVSALLGYAWLRMTLPDRARGG